MPVFLFVSGCKLIQTELMFWCQTTPSYNWVMLYEVAFWLADPKPAADVAL